MSFAVVLEGMSVVAYLIVLSGGKRLRESGWRVLSLLIILSAVVQAASMSLVVSVIPLLYRWCTKMGLGISVRQRRAVLRRLAVERVVDLLHCELVPEFVLRGGVDPGGAYTAFRGRL